MLVPVSDVWCCISEIERTVHTALITLYITPPGYVTQADFDLIWYLADYTASSQRKARYVDGYGLVPDVIVNPDESETPIYRFTRSWWPSLLTFFNTHTPFCSGNCPLVLDLP